jgi:hypothetical protein
MKICELVSYIKPNEVDRTMELPNFMPVDRYAETPKYGKEIGCTGRCTEPFRFDRTRGKYVANFEVSERFVLLEQGNAFQ